MIPGLSKGGGLLDLSLVCNHVKGQNYWRDPLILPNFTTFNTLFQLSVTICLQQSDGLVMGF